MHVLCVAGARPNFIKIAPTLRALREVQGLQVGLVHTGQHYDAQMSDVFFQDLEIPKPDLFIQSGAGSHAEQTAAVMTGFDRILAERRPKSVLVVGDVNSTMACAVTAAKRDIPVAHVEAGLRSFDLTMPEEINRMVTDSISQIFFTTEESANRHLRHEGKSAGSIYFTGNVMIDSLVQTMPAIDRSDILNELNLKPRQFGLVTVHRPSNVDNQEGLVFIAEVIAAISKNGPVVFPVHPRTRKNLENFGLSERMEKIPGLILTEPMGYVKFTALMKHAAIVATDSGGVQEETTFLGVPCLTLRENTERPVTVEVGSNILIGRDKELLHQTIGEIGQGVFKRGNIPALWDGHAAERIAQTMKVKFL